MVKPAAIVVAGRVIGPGEPCYVIAEAGVNHNGSLDRAFALIDAAKAAGASAIKFQSFVTEGLVTRSAPKAAYQKLTTVGPSTQFEMLKALELDEKAQTRLAEACRARGITYLSTPYDWPSVELLDRIDVAAFKIASTDTTNLPFLEFVASTKRPILLSTGMCSLGEVEAAVEACRKGGCVQLVLLHCTSEYPSPINEVNLRAIETLACAFGCPVGFSDHTAGIGAAPWSVVAGACVVEKHFTLSRDLPGPDHRASIEPNELADLVRMVHDVESAMGDGIKQPTASELRNRAYMRKSVVARRAIRAGQLIGREDIAFKRPATGLAPAMVHVVVGARAARDIAPDEQISFASLSHG